MLSENQAPLSKTARFSTVPIQIMDSKTVRIPVQFVNPPRTPLRRDYLAIVIKSC